MPKRLLIADDDTLFLNLLTSSMEKRGWDVLTASTHADAIRHLDESQPEMLLLDLRFREADGFTVLEHIRTQGYTLPVVVLTNYQKSVYEERCAEYGILDYLVKMDWKIDRLLERIQLLAESA